MNSPADDGGTPLYLAAQDGHTECVRLLLEYGAVANSLTSRIPVALPLHPAAQFQRIEYVHNYIIFHLMCLIIIRGSVM